MSIDTIEVIGFDLDGTLYPSTPDIQKKIRSNIYKKIAKIFFISEERSAELFEGLYNSEGFNYSSSGSRTIKEIGRIHGFDIGKEECSYLIDDSIADANILDLIEPNPQLSNMLERLSQERPVDLITNSEKDLALSKLERLSVNYSIFEKFLAGGEFGSKSDGTVYDFWVSQYNSFMPGQFLYIGDNFKQDILPPKRKGMQTCLVGKDHPETDYAVENILDVENLPIIN